MAERYGILPSEVLAKATTVDLALFNSANVIKDRAEKTRKGENIADTFQQNEIDEMYAKFKEKHKNGNENKQKDI